MTIFNQVMFWRTPSKLRFNQQLSTTFMIGTLILSLVSSSLISLVISRLAENRFISEGIQMTNSFAAQSRLALLYGAPENAQLQAETVLGFPDVSKVAIFLPDRKPLLEKGASLEDLRVDWTATLSKDARMVDENAQFWVFAAKVAPSFIDDGIEPELENLKPADATLGFVQVAMSKSRLHALTRRVLVINMLIALSLATILLMILRRITKKLTTPLENLSKIMQRAQNGETQIRAQLKGPKDILDMEQAFNSMMAVLEQRESQLEEARDAALETAQAKAEFAAMVSHEIRTPLNGVLGMLNLINEVGDPERQKEYLSVAIHSGATLMALINDILDFSKIDAGKLEIEQIDFNPREMIEEVAALFAEKAQSKELELCLDIPPDLPVLVSGDLTRLRQILNNLLSNAIKFTEFGEVVVTARFQETEESRVRIDFSVRDTGIGIPVDAGERIFESFRQANTQTTRKFGGSGLGLTICKQLVELLGGLLRVESSPGQGSTFSFSIELDVKEACVEDRCYSDLNIIIAGKSPTTAFYLRKTLEFLGCVCRNVRSGQDVLSALSEVKDDRRMVICILDPLIIESELSVFIRKIQKSAELEKRIKIIILIRPCCYARDGGNLVTITLNKPVRFSALKNAIGQIIENSRSNYVVQNYNREIQAGEMLRRDRRILIVDDNRTNQLVAKAMLSESGFGAELAADGREAVDLAASREYDLILMDCNMPVMDGYEATVKIRSLPGKPGRVPIFAMTAVDNPDEIRRFLTVGMNDFLIKPINLAVLRNKLAQLFIVTQDSVEVASCVKASSIDDESYMNLVNAIGAKIGEIIGAFVEDTPNYLNQINAAMNSRDWVRLKGLVHGLKGSSRNLGANIFGAICREIEDLINERDVPVKRIEPLIEDLIGEYLSVEQNLLEKLKSPEYSSMVKNSGNRELILIADDDRSTRLTIANALNADGLLTEQATNGLEAIGKFIQFNPDLVIMDAMMPLKDGFEASREIKQLPDGRFTPILMVTALENDESIELAFKSGAADFIPKPVNLAVLRQRVKRVLDARRSEQRVKHLAFNDGLTGLPNRTSFTDRLNQDLAYARRNGNRMAILFIDIDYFKDVNDNLGHAAGDDLLNLFAKRIGSCVRTEDTLARLGGDEFVVALNSVPGPKRVDQVARYILKSLFTSFKVVGKEIFVGASIGIAIFPDHGADSNTLLKNADTAMYRAKASGRNNYRFYTAEMSASIAERIDLESDMRHVVRNNELILYYQPQIDLRSSRIVAAEALVRWKHPGRGFMLPGSFIPIAEEGGLIREIGAWCMLTACRQFRIWQDKKEFTGRVAVNISVHEFMLPSFIDHVRDCLRQSGLEGVHLEIEITENAVLDCTANTLGKLDQLANLGVSVAIDDFGVGYSAFSYLKRLKVQTLKIDRSFVRDVPEDHAGAAVIDGMIQLAHKLDLKVVAEGVEHQAQYDFLKQHDCDFAQGYLIAKPLSTLEFYNKYVLHGQMKSVR